MNKRTEKSNMGYDHFEQAYTSSDAGQFETLLRDLDVTVGSVNRNVDENNDRSGIVEIHYAENDEHQFQELQNFDISRIKSLGPRNRANRKVAGSGEYTNSDQRQFSELLAAQKGYEFDLRSSQNEPDKSAFSYTEDDQAAFDALWPVERDKTMQFLHDAKKPFGADDQKIDFIKIVDYDKELAKVKENDTRTASGLKVRYFD